MGSLSVNSRDPAILALVDALNAQTQQYGISPDGTLPFGVTPWSTGTQLGADGILIAQADSSGNFNGEPITIPRGIPGNIVEILALNTGFTSSALPPSTTDLPSDGSFGWHLNTVNGFYYFAYNNNGVIITPTVEQVALIIQQEAAANSGGTASGVLDVTGTEVANTFYTRRLTDIVRNDGNFVTFTPTTGGTGGTPPSGGTFQLPAGTYKISIDATFYLQNDILGSSSAMMGLFNVTGSPPYPAETYFGGSIPIIGTPIFLEQGATADVSTMNHKSHIECDITFTGSPRTYAIRHQGTLQADVRGTRFQGFRYTASTAQVNGAAPPQHFCSVRIVKTA